MRKIIIIALVVATRLSAATLVVKKTGGTYSTLASALAAASSGDTIRVDDSETYNEAFAPMISITLAAGNGCSPRMGSSSGCGLVLNGLSTSETLTVTGMVVSSQGYALLASSSCGNIVATRCSFDSTSDEIVHISRSSAASGSDIFDRCSIGRSSSALVGFYYSTTASPLPNFKLLACVMTADATGGGTGVKVTGSQTGPIGLLASTDILGCTLYGIDADERVTIVDCVFACNSTDSKFTYPGTPARVSYSAFANTLPTGLGPGCIKITSSSAMISPCDNPRLKSGSTLFNVGTSGTGNGVTYDLDGTAYPQFDYWDMGCYESSTFYSMTMTPTATSTPTETPTATETFTVTPTFTITLTPDWPTPPPTPVPTATSIVPWVQTEIATWVQGGGATEEWVETYHATMEPTPVDEWVLTQIETWKSTPAPTPVPTSTYGPTQVAADIDTRVPTPAPTSTAVPTYAYTPPTPPPTCVPTATAIPVPTSAVPYVQTAVAAALTAVPTPVATATAVPTIAMPKRATMWHDEALVTSGNAILNYLTASQRYGFVSYQNAPATVVGDTFTNSFFLSSAPVSVYSFYVLGYRDNYQGIVTFTVDGVTIVALDWYRSAGLWNATTVVSPVTISTTGYHTLQGKITGQNGSSLGYYFEATKYGFYPASD